MTNLKDTALLIAAAFVAVGGVAAILLARRAGHGSPLPVPGLERLSAPTHAVLGVTLVLLGRIIAAPVFGWSGVRGPFGMLLALGLIAGFGSIILDRMNERDSADDAE